jgi:hypothetical protein
MISPYLRQVESEYQIVLRRSKQQQIEARQQRRDAFRAELDGGSTCREIGEALGIHYTRVGQIARGD